MMIDPIALHMSTLEIPETHRITPETPEHQVRVSLDIVVIFGDAAIIHSNKRSEL